MLPIAGISYEIIKLSGKKRDNKLLKVMTVPGLLMQKITTREPTDDQLEVALTALKAALQTEEAVEKEKTSENEEAKKKEAVHTESVLEV